MNEDQLIHDYLEDQINCISDIKQNSIQVIKKISEVLIAVRDNGHRVYIAGNGGSASTATHFTSDLLKTSLVENTNRFKAFSLSDNVPVVLAWANDSSFDNIFASQLENLIEKDDVLIAISGSGNSINVIKAVEYANSVGAKTISLTGKGGGKLSVLSKINLIIPSNDMLAIETMHLLICHLLTTIMRSSGKPMFRY